MRSMHAGRLALVYAGCFLGAGYLSGQELWQFFGAFGIGGAWGLLLCGTLQTLLCILLFSLVRRSRHERVEQVVIRRDRRRLRAAVGTAQLISLLGVCIIMAAGAGALAAQTVGGGVWVSLVFCAAVSIVSLRGLRALVAVLSAIVPLLVVAAFTVSVWAVAAHGPCALFAALPAPQTDNPLLVHWSVSAVLFVSYNLFGSIAVLIPLALAMPDAAAVRRGAALGTLLLLLCACAILLALSLYPETTAQELPMLALAHRLHPMLGRVFAVLLLCAMFGTALTCTVAAQSYLAQHLPRCARRPRATALAVGALSFAGGTLGFGDLIGWLYPLFGYLGAAVLCAIVLHERHLRCAAREKKG